GQRPGQGRGAWRWRGGRDLRPPLRCRAVGVNGQRWSTGLGFTLSAVGAAVGLGSIWRFPYLAGAGGGFAFIAVFVLACLVFGAPGLVGEILIGRWSRQSPPLAAGAIAARFG